MAAADRPHLVLWLGRARPWYAERMGSLTSTAQLWSRARPAHAVRARSPRRAFAHQAGSAAGRGVLTVLSCRGTDFSCGGAADFVELKLLARAAHAVCASHCPRRVTAHLHLQPIHRFPMFDSLQHGTGSPAAIVTIIGGEVTVVFAASPALSTTQIRFARARLARYGCSRGSLPGGLEYQGGGQSGRGRAAERRLSSGGSGGPPARARQLRRRFAACQRRALCTRWLPKKSAHGSGRLGPFPRA